MRINNFQESYLEVPIIWYTNIMYIIHFINKQHNRVRLSFAIILLIFLGYQVKITLITLNISFFWVLLISPMIIYYFVRYLQREDTKKFLLIIFIMYSIILSVKLFI